MSPPKYVAPAFRQRHFTCGSCGTLCFQLWPNTKIEMARGFESFEVSRCTCSACGHASYWLEVPDDSGRQIYPAAASAPLPHDMLPGTCREDYLEARNILRDSPRGSTALLRLCIQKLLKELGEKGARIDDDIASLVRKGLAPQVQQALDVCRVVGNNAVHPGEIDIQDTPDVASSLFTLVNFIVEQMIERPQHIEALFNALPAGAKAAIARRDGVIGEG